MRLGGFVAAGTVIKIFNLFQATAVSGEAEAKREETAHDVSSHLERDRPGRMSGRNQPDPHVNSMLLKTVHVWDVALLCMCTFYKSVYVVDCRSCSLVHSFYIEL